jgi:predicted transcriptional regulator
MGKDHEKSDSSKKEVRGAVPTANVAGRWNRAWDYEGDVWVEPVHGERGREYYCCTAKCVRLFPTQFPNGIFLFLLGPGQRKSCATGPSATGVIDPIEKFAEELVDFTKSEGEEESRIKLHPNHMKRWTLEEEARLCAELIAGYKKWELAKKHGRSRAAIHLRVKKLAKREVVAAREYSSIARRGILHSRGIEFAEKVLEVLVYDLAQDYERLSEEVKREILSVQRELTQGEFDDGNLDQLPNTPARVASSGLSDYVSTLENKVLEFAAMEEISASDTELQSILEVGRPRASQLLNSMHEKGMLERRRKGKKVLYKIPSKGVRILNPTSKEAIAKVFEFNTLYKRELSHIHIYEDTPDLTLKKSEQIDVTLTLPEIGTPDVSTFDPALTLNTGPTTSNLVTCFFLSNPNKKFSREEVFAHLNRHCEDWGIGDFFRTELKWDFTFSRHEHPLEGELLQIGRNSVLREIENLERIDVLTKDSIREGRSKYHLGGSGKSRILLTLSMALKKGADYSKLIEHLRKRKRKIADIHHVVNKANGCLKTLVDDWWGDIQHQTKNQRKTLEKLWKRREMDPNQWGALVEEDRCLFRTRLARLSYYCELTGEGFATTNRKWFELFENLIMDFVKENEKSKCGMPINEYLYQICLVINVENHMDSLDIMLQGSNEWAEIDGFVHRPSRGLKWIRTLEGPELAKEFAKRVQTFGSF